LTVFDQEGRSLLTEGVSLLADFVQEGTSLLAVFSQEGTSLLAVPACCYSKVSPMIPLRSERTMTIQAITRTMLS